MRPSKQILAQALPSLLIAGAAFASFPSGEHHGIRRDGTLLRPGTASAPAADAPSLVRALDLLTQRAAHMAAPHEDPRVLALVPLDRGWGSGTSVRLTLRTGAEEVEFATPAVTHRSAVFELGERIHANARLDSLGVHALVAPEANALWIAQRDGAGVAIDLGDLSASFEIGCALEGRAAVAFASLAQDLGLIEAALECASPRDLRLAPADLAAVRHELARAHEELARQLARADRPAEAFARVQGGMRNARGVLLSGLSSFLQTCPAGISEIEPNDDKSTATVADCMVSGDSVNGITTSAATTGLDNFLLRTCELPPGIYRHEMVITTSGTVGHTGTLRGLNQTGTVGTCPANGTGGTAGTVDTVIQTSSTASTPPRMNAWYGFGKGERIYYRVTGTASTTGAYTATLSTTPVSPIVVPGTFQSGTITLKTDGQTTVDTDIILLDKHFDVVTTAEGGASNDDEHCVGSNGLQSWLMRNLPEGTYYLGVGAYNTSSNVSSPVDDDFVTGALLDLPGSVASSATTTGSDRDFQITDGTNTYTSSGLTTSRYFEIVWVKFNVSDTSPGLAYCDPGTGSIPCPCGNPPTGLFRGCNNSANTGGASITAMGDANLGGDTLVLASSNQTPNGTTIVLQGTAPNFGGQVFGMGVRCVAGSLKRLYTKSPGGTGGVAAPIGADLTISARSAALGDPIGPGQQRHYMTYYRDPVVLGGCPPLSTFNGTNALQVTWN